MDRKGLAIFILAIVVLALGIFVLIDKIKNNTRDDDDRRIADIRTQERKYRNEDSRKLLDRDRYRHHRRRGERYRRRNRYYWHENRQQFQDARYSDNKTYRKAVLTYETGQYKEAFALFTDLKVDSLSPELSSRAYYYIASCLRNMGQDRKALLFLGRVVQNLKPNTYTTKAIILQGEINRKYQYSNESLEIYLHKLYMETPNGEEKQQILTQLGYLKLFRNDLDGALEHFNRSATVLSQLGKARVHVRRNEYWKSVSIYEDLIKHKNFHTQPYYKDITEAFQKQTYYYAKRWLSHGDLNHAYFYLRKIVNFFPNSLYGEAALYHIGTIFMRRRLYGSALRYFNLVLKNDNPNKNAAAQFQKGIIFHRLRRPGAAMRQFDLVRQYYRSSPYSARATQWIKVIQRDLMYR